MLLVWMLPFDLNRLLSISLHYREAPDLIHPLAPQAL
jgi:hypothetical protein